MGLMKLIDQFGVVDTLQDEPLAEGQSTSGNSYTFTLAGAADEVTPALIKGELDMACVPANLASVLYNKTEGQIVTLAVNTLGVIYIVENGNAVQSMADLAGKTIVAAGAATMALLPQPVVAVAQTKLPDLRVALDLTEEWDALDNGSGLITGVVVARKAVVEENPGAVDAFLADYAESVDWVNSNTADAAQLIGEYGIVDAAVAEKALPYCNIVCITGSEMKTKLSGYLQVLSDAEASSVGGALPEDDFYYGA